MKRLFLSLILATLSVMSYAQGGSVTPIPPGPGGGIQNLTTLGSSGPSTFIGNTLNIPVYSSGGGYTGCTTDGVNGINCLGQVQAGNYLGPVQQQNPYELVNTYTKIAKMVSAAPAQLRIRMDGDSTAGMHNPGIFCELRRRFGDAGFAGGGGVGGGVFGACGLVQTIATTGTVVTNNGTTVPFNYNYSPEGAYYDMSPGSCLITTGSGGYAQATVVAAEYIQEPGAGTLEILTDLNGAGYVSQGTQSAAGTLSGQVFQKTLTEGFYKLKICTTVANVKVYNTAMFDTAKNGVIVLSYGRGGLNLPDYTSTPTIITSAWDAFENPDLVMFHMVANGNLGYPTCNYSNTGGSTIGPFSQFWTLYSNRWLTGGPPTRDIFVEGSYAAEDTDCILTQNAVQQAWAKTNGKHYFDGYYIGGSIANQVNLGWLTSGDHAHQTSLGQVSIAEVMIRELGLNSLLSGSVNNDITNTNISTKNRIMTVSGGFASPANPALETVVPINSNQDIGYTFSRGAAYTANAPTTTAYSFNNTGSATDPNFVLQATGATQLQIRAFGDIYSQTANPWTMHGPASTLTWATNGTISYAGSGNFYVSQGLLQAAGQIQALVATGTAPFSVTSTTPVANLVVQKHPQMSSCGTTTTCANTAQLAPRIVHGNVALSSGSAVVASMTAWTATTSFDCTGTDTTALNPVKIVNTSTTSITITGTTTDVISYICVGN